MESGVALCVLLSLLACSTASQSANAPAGTTNVTTGQQSVNPVSTADATTSRPVATTDILPDGIKVALELLKSNPQLIQKFIPLWNALQPYLNQGGGSNNPLVPKLANKFFSLLLVDFPKVLNSTLTHHIVDAFVQRVSHLDLSGVDKDNAGAVVMAILSRYPWNAFLNDLYLIAEQGRLLPANPSLQTKLELILLNFTLGTLPNILTNPLVWATKDLLSKHVMAVNFTGVDSSLLGPVLQTVFFQVNWSEVLREFYDLLRQYHVYPQSPSVRFTIESLLLNFTLDTVPNLVKNPLFQALDWIVMGQIRKMNLTGVDPRNIGQLISTVLIQIHPEQIISKINALPGIQMPNKAVLTISPHCVNDMTMAYQGLVSGKSWALKMLDASGKLGPGLLKGNLYMVGNSDQCLDVRVPDYQTILRSKDRVAVEYERFKGKYCRVTIDLPQSFVDSLGVDTRGIPIRLSWGLCVPSSCSGPDFKGMLTSGFMSHVDIKIRDVFCGNDPKLAEDGSAITAIVILSVLLALTVIGTLVEIISNRKNTIGGDSTENKKGKSKSNMISHTNGGYVVDGLTKAYSLNSGPVVDDEKPNGDALAHTSFSKQNGTGENGAVVSEEMHIVEDKRQHERVPARPRKSVAVQLWTSFSLISNIPKVLAAKHPKDSITCLNGIRYLSMAWVILCHTFYYGVFSITDNQTTENMIDASTYIQRFTFMPLVYGTFSVDTFFVLSGFLVAFLFFKDIDKRKGRVTCKKMIVFYVHRFWRLTPIYMIVIMMFTGLHKYIIYGPLLPRDMSNAENCRENWWTNLLYINNLVHEKDMCMGWTWYLANDMQFYIISPIFILALYFFPVVGVIITSLLVAASITSSAIIENRGAGNMLSINREHGDKPDYYNDLYVKPWCRVGAYAIGLLLAQVMYKCGKRKMPTLLAALGWVLALTVGLFLVYIGYTELKEGGEAWSQPVRTAYESLSRPAFAACVAWVIYACHTGRGGYINSILSWKGLIPLARLTYAAYLIHPIIMFMYMYRRSTLIYLSDYVMVYFYLGHLVIAYASAFILSVLFESPFLGLEKIILKLLGA